MSGVRMVITFEDAPLREQLDLLSRKDNRSFRRVLDQIGEEMIGEAQDNIHEQKLFDGSAMPQSKAAQERNGKTLLKRGHLRDSYTYAIGLNADHVDIGSDLVYAAAQHFGMPARTVTARPGKMLSWGNGKGRRFAKSVNIPALPARPVLGMTERRERLIGDLFIREIGAAA